MKTFTNGEIEPASNLNKALFLDRDGTIVDYVPYLSKPEQVMIPLGAALALKQWQDAGYLLVIVTNQSGIGRGYFTTSDLEAIHARICQEYANFKVFFHDILVCPHHPAEACQCRKPSPYMLFQSSKKHKIDVSRSFFVGDAPSDIECAIHAGCHPILVLTGRGQSTAKNLEKYASKISIFDSLKDTVQLIQ